jgi:hypothetical protein
VRISRDPIEKSLVGGLFQEPLETAESYREPKSALDELMERITNVRVRCGAEGEVDGILRLMARALDEVRAEKAKLKVRHREAGMPVSPECTE